MTSRAIVGDRLFRTPLHTGAIKLGEADDVRIQVSPARRRCGRRRDSLAREEEAKLLAGGHTLIPTMKLAARRPQAHHRYVEDRGSFRHRDGRPLGDHRRHDAARRGGELAAWSRRRSRRLPTSPARSAIRPCAIAAPSAARSPTTIRMPTIRPAPRARRHHHHQQASHRGRRILQGPVRDRARGRRDHHQGAVSQAEQGGLCEISATRPRAMRWSAYSCPSAARKSAWR